jgi:TolB-like protein/class 3 adenylate cyclase/Tfp pilus assembly protein PilF
VKAFDVLLRISIGIVSYFYLMRQLAAILFADISGYTAIMQENEQLARLKRKRFKDALAQSVLAFEGKVLQNYGDGSLLIFNSARQAVACGIEIQMALQQEPRVDVRIGIHSGDVTVEDESIYGDGVNVASRIESMAIPGSILLSGKVHDEIRNQHDILTIELGFFELKNVKDAVRIFAVSNEGILVPSRAALKGKTRIPVNRIAVLPFVNMSADPDNEYFSDGITEELLNALTKIENVQVTSRTSVFAFKGKNVDVRDIGIQLNVDKILEGSVRKSGNRLRITAQWINAADGYHIWSENYDRDLTDIFEIQDEISGIIANKLRVNLSSGLHADGQTKANGRDVEAYTLYLKGLHSLNKLTPPDTRQAIAHFESAIELEPSNAQAHAMIANAYSFLGSSGQMVPKEAFYLVHKHADLALQLDPTIAEGHIAKAAAYLHYEWKWEKAHDALQKSIELNPTATTAYQLLAYYYVIVGQKEKAIPVMEAAIKLDPLSPMITHHLGNIYVFNERFDDAIRQAEKLLAIDPGMRMIVELKAWSIGMKGDWEKALPLFLEVHRLTNHPLKGLMGLGFAYGKIGDNDKAFECIRKVEQRQREEPGVVLDNDLAAIWFGVGDLGKTFYYIEESLKKRTSTPALYLEYPAFKELRADPRYAALMKRVRG